MATRISVGRARRLWAGCAVLALSVSAFSPAAHSVELTLDQALERAVEKTSRGAIIEGRFEVKEQTYQARRTNFYFPEISINAQTPEYNEDQSYRFFGGLDSKQLISTQDLGFRSFIEANQSLITGGDLRITANLQASEEEYPVSLGPSGLVRVNENSRRSFFEFGLTQPILKPSEAKNDLHNKRDDRELARLTMVEETAALKKEVIEGYIGLLRQELALQLAGDKLQSARLQVEIDSSKFADGVLSEEDFLISRSEYLDAELAAFEAETEMTEERRSFAQLLDFDSEEPINITAPDTVEPISQILRQTFIDNWENALSIKRSRLEYHKAERQAGYTASSHGLNGDLEVNYSIGRGTVENDIQPDNDINTNSWGISLNLSYPLWDGGASSSAVQAARLEAEQARLEYQKAEKAARAEILNMVNRLDVSYRRLGIVRQQVDLADNRLEIARSRLEDGQISELTFLESRIHYYETRDKYLEELQAYYINQVELSGSLII